MFKKLISNLAFSPQVFEQVVFYGRRLSRENVTRKLALIFGVLAFGLQLVVFASPPEATTAASTNDIIWGGLATSDPTKSMLTYYDVNSDFKGHKDIQAIFNHFHISRQDIAEAKAGTVDPNDSTYYSLGRNPSSNLDQVINIGGSRYYLRPYSSVVRNKVPHKALIGTRSGVIGTGDDRFFAILYDCGNIVIRIRPKPDITMQKYTRPDGPAANSVVSPGQTLTYRVLFNNIGPGNAHFVAMTDVIPPHTTYEWHGSGGANRDTYFNNERSPFIGQPAAKHVIWEWNVMPGQAHNWYTDLNVKVNSDAPDGARICNTAILRAIDVTPRTSTPVCHTVQRQRTAAPPAPLVVQQGSPNVSQHKEVSNITSGKTDANGSTAKAGDILEYKLITINSGNGTANGYIVTENIQDILEYAEVLKAEDAELTNGTLIWPAIDVQGQSSLVKTFQVRVKDPIPRTPRAVSSRDSFDLKMSNEYGNTVIVKLKKPAVKVAEDVVAELPNTGVSLNTVTATGFLGLTSYFFFRNKQLIKEIGIIRREYGGTRHG